MIMVRIAGVANRARLAPSCRRAPSSLRSVAAPPAIGRWRGQCSAARPTDTELIRAAAEAWQQRDHSGAPAPPLRFPVGAPVKFRIGESEWASGKVVAHFHKEKNFPENVRVPYQVLLDVALKGDLNAVWAPADDDACIRSALRFELGAAVECCIGGEEWARGKVVAHFHREPTWEPNQFAPYQVRLDELAGAEESALRLMSSGELIWAPLDADECIRVPEFEG